MTRTPIIAGNWKMNKTPPEAAVLARDLVSELRDTAGVEIVLCPAFVALPAVRDVLAGTPIGLGAQNMHWERAGAFTGEISPVMLAGWCSHVILGHSERRQLFGETDEGVNRKVLAAIELGLAPIICVGETLAEFDAGQTAAVVSRQVRAAYQGVPASAAAGTVLAYEPIWAIGTGRASTGANANSVIGLHIRGALSDLYGLQVADAVRVQYGGSVTPANIAEFMAQPDIDGALVGGGSLKAADFVKIVMAAVA
jgi:triosephosphate isomerase